MSPTKGSRNGNTEARQELRGALRELAGKAAPGHIQESHRAELQAAADAANAAQVALTDATTTLEFRKMQVRQCYGLGQGDTVDLVTGEITRALRA